MKKPHASWFGLLLLALPVTIAAIEDPGSAGPYATARVDYQLADWTVGTSTQLIEVRADVHYPSAAPGSGPVASGGPFPIVVMVHGAFAIECYKAGSIGNADRYPCNSVGTHPFPSYLGFDYLGEALASHGYVTVSISTLGVGILNGFIPYDRDENYFARGAKLVQHHLTQWQGWSTSGGAPFADPDLFVGKVDLQNVGVMGHSRGGEIAVRYPVENAEQPAPPFTVNAVLAIAPTNLEAVFAYEVPVEEQPTAGNPILNGVATGFINPYCDGDVKTLSGNFLYDRMRYVDTGNARSIHGILAMGANHAFFNRAWCATDPPYDSLPCPIALGDEANYNFEADTFCDSTVTGNGRLTRAEQEAFAITYVAAFFRRYLGGQVEFEPVLTGDVPPPPSAQSPELHFSVHPPAAARLDVNRTLDAASLTVNDLGGAVSEVDLDVYALCGYGTTSCIDASDPTVISDGHSAKRFRLAWDGPAEHANLLQSSGGSVDVGGHYALQFRAAVHFQESPDGADQDLRVALYDGQGQSREVRVGDHSDALFFPPGLQVPQGGQWSLSPLKSLLNTVSIPLSAFDGVDLTDVTEVVFFFDEENSLGNVDGEILVTDLAFASPPGVSDLDRDGVIGVLDNCSELANAGTDDCDGDVDGYGNFCDADLNNDGAVNTSDMDAFSGLFTALDPAVDMNCDGAVNSSDVTAFVDVFNSSWVPGPSGLPCAGTVPCD